MQTHHMYGHLLSPTRSLLLSLVLLFPLATASSQEGPPHSADSVEYSPGDHELFLMPTAYTMNEGDAYFSDYELFFLNFTYAPTSRTHVGVMTLFPITSDFVETITLGLKQNYVRTTNFEAALWGSYTIKNNLYSIGSVFSIGRRSLSLHMACSLTGEAKESNNMLLLLVGARADISRKLCGIVEYTNAKELLDQDFNGLISIGLRFRGESTSWELAGIRPLERTGDFLFLPFLKATFLF